MSIRAQLIEAAQILRCDVDDLEFSEPVTHVYSPLDYAWPAHEAYLRNYGQNRKRVVFLGMNPGPFGMAQTGVPFGEVAAVRDWMHIDAPIGKPEHEHPKRPVEGLRCHRSEVSGRRLWGLFANRFPSVKDFFADHFVANYCPLIFFAVSGRNLTPDKIRKSETERLFAACDQHLQRVVEILEPEWLIGVGGFAAARARSVCTDSSVKVAQILHPSPASPAANRDWAGHATKQLRKLGVW